MIMGATGHRPNKLTPLKPDYSMWLIDFQPHTFKIYMAMKDIIKTRNVTRGNCGMALGSDIIWFNALLSESIPIHAYIPCVGQEAKWNKVNQQAYHQMLKMCEKVIICSEGPWKPGVEQIRNERMVDDSEEMTAVWDGYRGGGTWNCLEYVFAIKKPVTFVDFKFL